MALNPLLPTPVPMLPGLPPDNFNGYEGGVSGSTGVAQFYAPVPIGSKLYACVQAVGSSPTHYTPEGGIFVESSADGAVWTLLDAANGPSRTNIQGQQAGMFFDGAHTITVCYAPSLDPITPVASAVQFQDFDTNTNTWGAIYGAAGSPVVYQVNQIFKRPDGSILFLYSDTFTGSAFIGLKAAVFSAGSWGSPFAVDSGLSGGFVSVSSCSACMDSTGAVHVFGIAKVGGQQELWYQRIDSTDALTTFDILQGPVTGNLPGSGSTRQCCVFGDIVAIGGFDTSSPPQPAIFAGTPLSAPVFTMFASIDPGGPNPAAGGSPQCPAIAADSTGFYAIYPWVSDTFNGLYSLRITSTPNVLNPASAGWSGITAFNGQLPGPNIIGNVGMVVIGGVTSVTYNAATAFGPFTPRSFWAGLFPGSPPTPTSPVPAAITGGLPYGLASVLAGLGPPFGILPVRGGCGIPNRFDECLFHEHWKLKRIRPYASCVMPNGVDPFTAFWDEDGGFYPEQSSPVFETGSLLTPAAAAGMVPVLSFRIPTGYDAILTGITLLYTGTGFEDGSGDILWFVQKGQRYLKDLANLAYSLGNVDSPAPLTFGQLVQAGQVITVFVSVPNLSGNIQVGNSRVVAQMWGARWPRG